MYNYYHDCLSEGPAFKYYYLIVVIVAAAAVEVLEVFLAINL
jgi:hypothetical protein